MELSPEQQEIITKAQLDPVFREILEPHLDEILEGDILRVTYRLKPPRAFRFDFTTNKFEEIAGFLF